MTKLPPDMKVRLSYDLRKKIEKAARENRRTLNGEIAARLEASFEDETTRSQRAYNKLRRMTSEGDPLESRVSELEERIKRLEKQK